VWSISLLLVAAGVQTDLVVVVVLVVTVHP
jgi:hypothetical protein